MDKQTADNIRAARSLSGRPPDDYMVGIKSVKHLLEERAAQSPDKVWLIHYDADGRREQYTYKQFNERVNQVANLLAGELGVKHGDRVATIAYNHADTVMIYFACWKLGATVAPQNVAEDDQRIAFILRNSEAVVVFVREEYLERAASIINGEEPLENVRQIVKVGGEPQVGYLHFETAITGQATTFIVEREPSLEDESLLVYTSGTTGPPKGVVLMQYNMLVDAMGIADWQAITAEQRMMCVLPIHHVNGTIVTLLTPLMAGASVVLNRAYSSSNFWRRIADEKVNVVSVVPTLLQFSLEYCEARHAEGKSIWGEGISKDDLSPLRHLICGAGTLAVVLARRFEDMFEVPILHGYGLSETDMLFVFPAN